MNSIQLLPPKVVDQIAAGEVVERPASVIKELVENALDAGAKNIEVRLQEGGLRSMEVRDDGCGIAAEDLPLAVTSHATSKLRKPEDLDAIATMGFRGEALASVASVSRLLLTSKTAEASHASQIRVDFGRGQEVREVAGVQGTRVLVEDLFAELPGRRKFLKKAATELSHCRAWVERLALSHQGVGFRLFHQQRLLFEVQADEDLDRRCGAVFGSGLAERMVKIEERGTYLSLEARVGPPESARRDAGRVHLYLNGRWVRDARLLRAVREGVREFVESGHYPTLYLAMALPPERADVNVHPQKLEVRFRDSNLVFASLVKALRRGLAQAPWATRQVGELGSEAEAGGRMRSGSSSFSSSMGTASQVWERPLADSSGQAAMESQPDSAGPAEEDRTSLPFPPREQEGLGPILSVANTFLVREVPGGMEILDQHALHERVNLEELRREIRQGQVISQPLLIPALVDVGRQELALLLERSETFRRLGVEIEAFGETTLAIRAVPARLERLQADKLVMDLLDLAREHRQASPENLQEEALYRMACRGAVMAGDRLDEAALRGLLQRGAKLPQDRTCAHGRPVRVFLSLADLEKAFHRR